MKRRRPGTGDRAVEPFDHERLEERLREAARVLFPGRTVDDQELRHMIRVVTECSLLLTDVYSDDRIARIMEPDRAFLSNLIDSLISKERRGEGEVLYRVRRLPDDVRMIGDKALFDLGLRGLRRVKGYDLHDLGARAYRVAGEVLELLAEDRKLREFFKQNRLLVLPLEQEVSFLRQCSDKFSLYADILKRVQEPSEDEGRDQLREIAERVPLLAAVAEALEDETGEAEGAKDEYLEAARSDADQGTLLSQDELISSYQRTVLFSSLDMDRLRAALRTMVVDQDEAVEQLCNEFSLFSSGTRDLRKPPSFFLVGPTGVGKNHLVETLCRLLEGLWKVEVPMLTIEGPSYTYPSDIHELRGATRGFIRSDEEGLLGAFHERSSKAPFSVILVDEVEKAHPQLRRFFLSIMDRGTVTDNRGRTLNFANSLIFFTSNLGYSEAAQATAPIGYLDEPARERASEGDAQRGLRRTLSPEFMNRVRIIRFSRLGPASAGRILDLEFEKIARRYRDVHGLELELDVSAREELLRRGFSPAHGARRLAARLEVVCNVEISKRIRQDDRRTGGDRETLLAWLGELRAGTRPFEANEVRRKVLDSVRADLGYRRIVISFDGAQFEYRTDGESESP